MRSVSEHDTLVKILTTIRQVAMERTRPQGRVIGIDLLPAQPPRGVATFQGDFLSPAVQRLVKDFISESCQRQPPPPPPQVSEEGDGVVVDSTIQRPSYIDIERSTAALQESTTSQLEQHSSPRLVDVRFETPDLKLSYII